MTSRLQAIVPAMFQPVDPIAPADPSLTVQARSEKLTMLAAITSAVLVVGLIAVLMGIT